MPQTAILCALLAVVLAWFAPGTQHGLQAVFKRRPALIFAAPVLLTATFAAASAAVSAFSGALVLLILAYTLAPTLVLFLLGERGDFAAILLLWLPIELSTGAALVPAAQQGFLHSVAYAVAILLGLTLFLGFRRIDGMKYNLPRGARDWWLPFVGFVLAAPVLIGLGIAIGFIPPPHMSTQPAGKMAAAVAIIFVGTALPEEILFRGLIQNLAMQRFGANWKTLLVTSFVFGLAHLDNGPQPLPNWRYMILATIAGVAYGEIFRRSRSIISSATLHMMVDWTKHFYF
jgi:membrane protease YdiL (CAAX protease family)